MKQPSEFLLLRFRQAFEAFGDPIYAWAALALCPDQKPLPPWLMEYLVQCSKRMLSEKADQASDLRAILPWVLDFPTKRAKKSWPDKIDLRTWKFVTEFGVRILQGEDPVAARQNACNDAFGSKRANVDDKTLVRWLHQAFLLKKAPKDAQQWKKIVLGFAAVMDANKQFANMDMTSAEAAKAAETADNALKWYGTFSREILG
jgi:hypothetical protein